MIKNLKEMQFGDRYTRDRWLAACREAKAAGRARGVRYVVAPRHSLPSEHGLIAPGTEVSESDLVGFTSPYAGNDGTEQLPLTPSEALQRALDFGIVLEC